MRVNNNPSSFSVFKYYERATNSLAQSMERLSSGLRIVRPGDDAAGLAISEKFRAQVKNTDMSVNNVQNLVSMIQTTDGWMQNMHDMLGRMSELAIEARDSTKSTADLLNIQTEFKQIQNEISAITTGASARGKYNSNKLFSTGGFTIQVGPDFGQTFTKTSINLNTTQAGNWGQVFTVTVSTAGHADSAIQVLNSAIINIATKRATLGAEQNRLQYTIDGLRSYSENIGKAESQIRDVNVALETPK
jgi:flagellin